MDLLTRHGPFKRSYWHYAQVNYVKFISKSKKTVEQMQWDTLRLFIQEQLCRFQKRKCLYCRGPVHVLQYCVIQPHQAKILIMGKCGELASCTNRICRSTKDGFQLE